jgi:drug/metabolite transporter (DMT)-like permease
MTTKLKNFMNNKIYFAICLAILAALLYGFSTPISKLLLVELSPFLLAALLYLGAGFGMLIVNLVQVLFKTKKVEAKLTKKELPFILGMIFLDILAPVLLMFGLGMTTSANASLLNNFEIVATSIIALVIFKEVIGRKMWIAIGLVFIASVLLSFEDLSAFSFSLGSLLVLGASISWGLENNFTRKLSIKDPLLIVVIKGLGSGVGSLSIAYFTNMLGGSFQFIIYALILGFFAYGMSIYFYITAQRTLGAARTSAYYATAPFIGVILSWIFLGEEITLIFGIALIIMVIGAYLAFHENKDSQKNKTL